MVKPTKAAKKAAKEQDSTIALNRRARFALAGWEAGRR